MSRHSETAISIAIEGEITLKVGEVWPDGNAPDQVDAHAVADEVRRCGGVSRLLSEWNLSTAFITKVDVYAPNPHFKQDTALLPDEAPSPFIHSREWVA